MHFLEDYPESGKPVACWWPVEELSDIFDEAKFVLRMKDQ
jgi:hypothetical protein